MRTTLMILVGCVLLLVAAYFASRMLEGDVPPPVSTAVAVPEVVRPEALAPPPPSPPSQRYQEAQAAMLAVQQGQATSVPPAPAYPQLTEAPMAAEVAESPFQGDSKELDYAEALLAEANPGPERLASAHSVLSRCVKQEPNNKRCRTWLAIAQNRLGGKAATDQKPEAFTLQPPMAGPASKPR